MNIKKVNVFMGIIFFKLYFIYLVFKNVFRKLGNILMELLKILLNCLLISKEIKICVLYS